MEKQEQEQELQEGKAIDIRGHFVLDLDIFASEEDVAKMLAGDQEVLALYRRQIGESAQETVAWGDTPFIITESNEVSALLGTTFSKEVSSNG